MQANELRVGNWVNFINHDDDVFTEQITGKNIEMLEYRQKHPNDPEGRIRYESSWQPIPLTPEILEECGFVKTTIDRVVFWELEVGRTGKFQFYKGVMQFGVFGVANYEYHDVRPQYLHQLQNLYFSLTNTELQWNRKQ